MQSRWFVFTILIMSTLYGCKESVKFVDFTPTVSQQWLSSDSKYFMFRNQSSQTSGDIFLCINYTNLDREHNINIELEVQTPAKKLWATKYTIPMEITDRVGKIESKKEIKLIENCEFTDIGVYRFKVRQTSTPSLDGVTSIGIAIK